LWKHTATKQECIAGRSAGEKRSRLEATSNLLLVGDGADRQTARGIDVPQSHQVQKELLLAGLFDRIVVGDSRLQQLARPETASADPKQ
jgi:hypothetical protein